MQFKGPHERQVHLQPLLRAGLRLLRAIKANRCPETVSLTYNMLKYNVHTLILNKVRVV